MEYYNRGAITLYLLTKYLSIEFEKPSLIGEVFITKVSILQLFLLIINNSGEVQVKYKVLVLQGEDKVIQVIIVNVLFILYKRLRKIPSYEEVYRSIKDLLIYRGNESTCNITLISVLRSKQSVLVLIIVILVAGFQVLY